MNDDRPGRPLTTDYLFHRDTFHRRMSRRAGALGSRVRYQLLHHALVAYSLTIVALIAIYIVLGILYGVRSRQLFSLLEAILGGVLASLGTAALAQYFLIQREQFGVRRWLRFGDKQAWIVPAYIDIPDPRRYPFMKYYVVPPFDAQAAAIMSQIVVSAGITYPRRKILGSHRVLREILDDNFVVLCLPERNQYARIFLGLYHQIYVEHRRPPTGARLDEEIRRFKDDTAGELDYFGLRHLDRGPGAPKEWQVKHFGFPEANCWFQSTINLHRDRNIHEQGHINYDYALVVKGPNPINRNSTVLIVCGIHGIGTLGGALFIEQHANQLFRDYGGGVQSHLIEIQYTARHGGESYIDSDILTIKHWHCQPFPE